MVPNKPQHPYTLYDGRPIVLKLGEDCTLTPSFGGGFTLSIGSPKKTFLVAPNRCFDLVPATVDGLMDELVDGSELKDKFLEEVWIGFEEMGDDWLSYGTLVWYPHKEHLVRFATPFWHRLALVTRNSTLFRDPEMKLSWQHVREIFEGAVVAIAGCSVGNNIVHAIVGDLRPRRVKVADQREYKLTNANRVQLNYDDFGRNKAAVTALQLHGVDPFMGVSVFSEGVHESNIDDFMAGNEGRDEPSTRVIVEETDDPDMKILIREKAREHRIPVIMITDLGSAVQCDVRRFDLDSTLSLAACGTSDEKLFAKRDVWKADLANRDKFFEFAHALIGENYVFLPELRKIVLKEEPPMFAGIPQLGSTAMAAGGFAAETVARLLLGYTLPERMFIDKHTGKVLIQGEV